MTDEQIYALVHMILFWIGAGVCWILSFWTIIATILEVAKKKSSPLHRDVIIGILFHGGLALAALKFANLAVHGT